MTKINRFELNPATSFNFLPFKLLPNSPRSSEKLQVASEAFKGRRNMTRFGSLRDIDGNRQPDVAGAFSEIPSHDKQKLYTLKYNE